MHKLFSDKPNSLGRRLLSSFDLEHTGDEHLVDHSCGARGRACLPWG